MQWYPCVLQAAYSWNHNPACIKCTLCYSQCGCGRTCTQSYEVAAHARQTQNSPLLSSRVHNNKVSNPNFQQNQIATVSATEEDNTVVDCNQPSNPNEGWNWEIKAGIEKLWLELRNLHCECSKRKGGRDRETKHFTQQYKYPNESLPCKSSNKFYPWYNLCFSILVDTVEIDVTSLIVVLELSAGW